MTQHAASKLEIAMQQERDRLKEEKKKLIQQQKQLQQEIDRVDAELSAIDAYEAARKGKPARTGTRRSGIRQKVLNTLKQYPDGLTRGRLIELLEARDKSSQQSISNALSALKRSGQITQHDGAYYGK